MKRLFPLLLATLLLAACSAQPPAKLRALIIDGQNNHNAWPKSTFMMKAYLEESGRFDVEIHRSATTWKGDKWLPSYPLTTQAPTSDLPEPQPDPDFHPKFSDYDVVISNFGWKASNWPAETKQDFEAYIANGGGLVVIHAANNAFGDWEAYNQMIGLGGWGGRDEKSGPAVYYNNAGELVRDDSPGKAGHHGPQHQYQVTTRTPEHPIMKGIPAVWLHTQDELYDNLRGPAENMTVLATAYSSPEFKGTDRHEPALIALEFGQGRIFHSILGHDDYSFACAGFITTFTRGAEWAATGEVTIPVPGDFPTAEKIAPRPFAGP
jgi:type 1 glutamine amidotransferase